MLPVLLDTVGHISGNHDRSSWAALHRAAWPLVEDRMRADGLRAIDSLDRARSAHRYAGGIDEVWALANEGRIATLVVEDGDTIAGRIIDGRLEPSDEREAPDVIDDVVDDTIEAVLRSQGTVVMVADGELVDLDRIAAVLRF